MANFKEFEGKSEIELQKVEEKLQEYFRLAELGISRSKAPGSILNTGEYEQHLNQVEYELNRLWAYKDIVLRKRNPVVVVPVLKEAACKHLRKPKLLMNNKIGLEKVVSSIAADSAVLVSWTN